MWVCPLHMELGDVHTRVCPPGGRGLGRRATSTLSFARAQGQP